MDEDTDASSEARMHAGHTGVPLLRGKKSRRSWNAPRRWPFVDETALQGVMKPPYALKKPWDDGFTNTWDNHCHINLRSYFDRGRSSIDWGKPTVPGQLKVTWMLNGPQSKELPAPPPIPKRKPPPVSWKVELGYERDPRVPVYKPRDPLQKKILSTGCGASMIAFRKPRPDLSTSWSEKSISQSTSSLPPLEGGSSTWSSRDSRSPWNDEFQHTYGNRFNKSVHKDFRQYFGAQSLHGAFLADVVGSEHGMKELMR